MPLTQDVFSSILARDSIIVMLSVHTLSPVRPSRLFVTRVDQSKTVEVRIMQLSPQVAP